MQINHVTIEPTFAEAFGMWASRVVLTAMDEHWVRIASDQVTGYSTSVIGCDAEAATETSLPANQTPDGRPGVAILFFAFNAKALAKAIPNRIGQCVMTCPTTAVFDGMPDAKPKQINKHTDRIQLGSQLRFFGDGHQKSKVIAGRRYWRIPVMDGEFVIEESIGAARAIGGGNFLVCGSTQADTLKATQHAVQVISQRPNIIMPFPGGIVRSGSKVGSQYKTMFASTNDAFCPTLRASTATALKPGVNCVYEIVINGLTEKDITLAMQKGISAACAQNQISKQPNKPNTLLQISAGNYGGNLGKYHFKLHDVLQGVL